MADVKKPEGSALSTRRFAVEPIESTTKSNRPAKVKEIEEEVKKSPRWFAPEPVETSSKSNRNKGVNQTSPKKSSSSIPSSPPSTGTAPPPRRKFAPQLIETTTRSRKKGDTVPDSRQITDKTDLSPGDHFHLPRHIRLERPSALPVPPENTPILSSTEVPLSRFSSSELAKNAPRRTSFRTPRLEPISSINESDESNPSNVPSLSTSPSANSEPIDLPKQHPSRLRESCDERFSGYLLALAARVAEQQLKEQAMAAYPNEVMHEPVDHFAADHDDGSEEEMGYGMLTRPDSPVDPGHRRESAAGWDLAEMRKHQSKLDEQRKAHKAQEEEFLRKDTPAAAKSPYTKPNPFGALPNIPPANNKPTIGGQIKCPDGELKRMRSAASPPMLGGDILFRSFLSPQQTMIDATQKPRRRDSKTPISRQHSGLWTPCHSNAGTPKNGTRKNSNAGLWGGHCQAGSEECSGGLAPPSWLQMGLMTPATRTPAIEISDPFAALAGKHHLPNTPPASAGGMAGIMSEANIRISAIDDVLSIDETLDREFPDCFVTQVYNYLSLGYPALARAYDHELSKISGVSVADIRKDDARKNTKGFVGAPEGEGSTEEEIKEACGRWRALRKYVREWGRQEGRMKEGNGLWGQAVRRGSWAI